MIYMKNCKKGYFLWKSLCENAFLHPGPRDPRIFWIFWFCGMCRCFLYVSLWSGSIFCNFPSFSSKVSLCTSNWVLGWHFFVIFLYFLQKYRCVPKIGFSATFLLTFLLAFFLTFILAFLLTFLLAFLLKFLTFVLTFLLTFLSAFVLTFWLTRRREEEWRSEGVDLFLKSNNPTPEGGEYGLWPPPTMLDKHLTVSAQFLKW